MGALWAMKKLKIQNPHLRTSLSIGGGGEMSATFPQVAANVNARQNFAQNARRLVDMYDLDGIDSKAKYFSFLVRK